MKGAKVFLESPANSLAMDGSVPHRVLVVGAGFAGLAVVKSLPETPQLQITVVDRRNHHLFQALLYQVASAGLNASEIASPIRSRFRNRKNVRVLMGALSAVDDEQKLALFDDGKLQLPYDTLVLAIGGQTSYFGNDTWKEHSFGLKSIEEALAIRKRVVLAFEEAEKCPDPDERKRLTTIVVVGGGPTGVELSGAFAELRSNVLKWDFRHIDPTEARIVLLEGGPRILSPFPEKLSEAARLDLVKLGVEVRLNEKVQDIRLGQVLTDQGIIETHTVVWAGGVAGHSLSKALGFETNPRGQVPVDSYLKIPGTSIFCLGDMAECVDQLSGQALPGMAPVAMQQGDYCGKAIASSLQGCSVDEFRYVDAGIMATVGRSKGVAVLHGRHYTGTLGWATWLWHHLLRIVDFQNRVFVGARWAWAYFAWKWGVRLVYDTTPEEKPHGLG